MTRADDNLGRASLTREWRVLREVWHAGGRHHVSMVIGMVIQLTLGIFPAWAVYVVQDSMEKSSHDLMRLVTKENALYVLLVLTAYTLLKKVSRVIIDFASIGVERNIRERYLQRLLTLPAQYVCMHMDQRGAMGMTMETEMAGSLIPMAYRSFLRAPIALLSALVLLFVVSPRFVSIVLAMLLVITVATLLLRSRLKKIRRGTYDTISMLYRYFNDWLLGYRLLKVYGCAQFLGNRLTGLFDRIAALSRKSVVIGSVQSFLVEFMTYVVAIVFIIFVTGTGDTVTLGVVVSFPAAIILIRSEALYISSGYQQLANTESSISRLLDVLNHTPTASADKEWDEIIESVAIEHVTFAYSSASQPVLRDITARFEIGRPNVVVGPSGAGKSTLINVILGLICPERGTVRYNGHNISDYSPSSLLARSAIVEQEPFIFSGTLWDNIAIGRSLRRDYVESLFREFSLGYLIDTPQGLDLMIGTGHRILSLGERQRLSLIRALADDPDFLILDEVTSNIDIETSRIIVSQICQLSAERLILCVSHDLVWRESNAKFFMLQNSDSTGPQFSEYDLT